MRRVHLVTAGLAILAALAAAPRTTHACSCASRVQLRTTTGQPEGGVEDVPRNVAPILTGNFDADSVEWTTEAGVPVAFTSRRGLQFAACGGYLMELVPTLPLAAATTYVVRVGTRSRAEGESTEFRFTTGANEAPERALPEPSLTATIVSGRAVYDSCVSEVHGCIAVGEHETEVTFLDEAGAVLNWTITSGQSVMERGASPGTACIEARTRDVAGRRSAPLRRCGSELGQREALRSDYDDYRLRCSEGRILPSPEGTFALPAQSADADAGETAVREDERRDAAPSTSEEIEADSNETAVDRPNEANGSSGADGCSAIGATPTLPYCAAVWIAWGSLRRRRRRARL